MTNEDYEIRFFSADGSLSHVLITSCASDEDAHTAALRKFAEDFKPFELWCGQRLVTKGPALPKTH